MDFSPEKDAEATAQWDAWGAKAQQKVAEHHAPPRPYVEILSDAEQFTTQTNSDTVNGIIKELHKSEADTFSVERVLKAAAKRTEVSVVVLRKMYASLGRAVVPTKRQLPATTDVRTLSGKELWDFLGLDQDERHALDNLNNAMKVLEADTRLAGHIWFDEFCSRIRTDLAFDAGDVSIGPEREWSDADGSFVTKHMQDKVGMSFMREETVNQAVRAIARLHPVNPPMKWMEGLVWDGVVRLPSFLCVAFGVEQSAYTAAVGRCFIMSIVARVFKPGCKVDTVPVFEGQQGAGKSQAIAILGGEWGAECHEQVTSKDFYQVLDGNMLVEIAEMHVFSRAEVNRIKGVISCPNDRYRAPYERHAADHPRRTVLVGTTNRDDWNTDETGARRFWPVRCTTVDLDWLRTHRDQLFAEAVARLKRGELWWDVPREAAEAAQAERRPDDVWTDCVRCYVDGGTWIYGDGVNNHVTFDPRDEVRIEDLLRVALRIPINDQEKRAEMRVAAILTDLGWRRVLRGITPRYRCWVRKMSINLLPPPTIVNRLGTAQSIMDFSNASYTCTT